MQSTVLVTGANGFIGFEVCKKLREKGFLVRAALRTSPSNQSFLNFDSIVVVGEINETTQWDEALKGVSAVIHLAARVHQMKDSSADPLSEARKINVEGTRTLAFACVRASIKRFVYLSSIKAVGEGGSYNELSTPIPVDPYGISKWEAEKLLLELAEKGLEPIILRPPLVYGPGVKANFYSLMKWIDRGLPLPLGKVQNLRSLVYVGNLVDAIILALVHPQVKTRTFFVTDDQDVSTADLVKKIANSFGRKKALISVPMQILNLIFSLLGKKEAFQRLSESLQADPSLIKNELGWNPPYSLEEGIQQTVSWYKKNTLSF